MQSRRCSLNASFLFGLADRAEIDLHSGAAARAQPSEIFRSLTEVAVREDGSVHRGGPNLALIAFEEGFGAHHAAPPSAGCSGSSASSSDSPTKDS
ncbi:hypothetical protein ACP_0377 [Acidobacterium capsulatum ATCC 51196]|uniref:Uncharacterized protein n=1 Tax=Acidobacterium capsulatum (strain ATCC 51196 / DSM 11244 / BCRC 80197 / JCM 7670 / NBRC 15755 / NCIMB 13165 / 161) TaxID=240015 RepID=C1F9Z9_ACIC5|nr:hypothetical protein ACP_0377 [Acidobacterium capsulatum ATCC 51196]